MYRTPPKTGADSRVRKLAGLLAPALLMSWSVSTSVMAVETTDDGLRVALLFHSARVAISRNQDLINDASKGDKGLTGDALLEQSIDIYKNLAKEPFLLSPESADSGKAERILIGAIRSTMDDMQSSINAANEGFKGFVPATFSEMVADRVEAETAGTIEIRVTNKSPRNRKNRADDWEEAVIDMIPERNESGKLPIFRETYRENGTEIRRFLLPEYYEPSCLSCHGGAAGERDITGAKREGAVLGEFGGVVSVTIRN